MPWAPVAGTCGAPADQPKDTPAAGRRGQDRGGSRCGSGGGLSGSLSVVSTAIASKCHRQFSPHIRGTSRGWCRHGASPGTIRSSAIPAPTALGDTRRRGPRKSPDTPAASDTPGWIPRPPRQETRSRAIPGRARWGGLASGDPRRLDGGDRPAR